MPDNPRIEELRRRVLADPASIAFAALAEEYRRTGNYAEAIETCRTGLQRHPSYLSARVTLGRALMEIAQYDEARKELELVLKSAPENLAAIRGLAEIHERQGSLPETDFDHVAHLAESSEPASSPAADAAPVSMTETAPPQPTTVESAPAAAAVVEAAPAVAAVSEAPLPPKAPEPIPVAVSAPVVIPTPEPVAGPDPVVARLEQFLVAIQSARTSTLASR